MWAALGKERRIPRTVVLKLKTRDFRILTRSLTPSSPPASCEELANIALSLRDRVECAPGSLYRLVGVGWTNFREPDDLLPQPELFR